MKKSAASYFIISEFQNQLERVNDLYSRKRNGNLQAILYKTQENRNSIFSSDKPKTRNLKYDGEFVRTATHVLFMDYK